MKPVQTVHVACVQIRLAPFQRGFSSSRVCEPAIQRDSANISIGKFCQTNPNRKGAC